tara:strand:+ start:3197 stop:3751 length:555 start_codon:yes stop_codon:yes gene_type:complete
MIFDRISLVSAYKALKYVNDNDGRVTEILFNRQAFYGTKTSLRFMSLLDLKNYISTEFPYQHFDPECDCGTGQESIQQLLSFHVYIKDLQTQIESKHAVFVNNLRQDFESMKSSQLNNMSIKKIQSVFEGNLRLDFLKDNYICDSYVQQQGNYVNPCDYIEIVSNDFYTELLTKHYYLTQNYDI